MLKEKEQKDKQLSTKHYTEEIELLKHRGELRRLEIHKHLEFLTGVFT